MSKKRKLEDPSQPKLDYFYQKNDPMQIDSSKSPSTSDKPPTLGSIRQQLIVPKVTIVNFSRKVEKKKKERESETTIDC